jgi:predicted nucleic acid-binding protein
MKFASVLYDTSVFITYKKQLQQHPPPGWHSSVVLAELLVGANGRSEIQLHRRSAADYDKRARLLIPDLEAWLLAGQILNQYLSDRSRASRNRERPKLESGEKQSLIRDVLIAVSAKKQGVTVVSDNEDFQIIRRYDNFKYIPARTFFT